MPSARETVEEAMENIRGGHRGVEEEAMSVRRERRKLLRLIKFGFRHVAS